MKQSERITVMRLLWYVPIAVFVVVSEISWKFFCFFKHLIDLVVSLVTCIFMLSLLLVDSPPILTVEFERMPNFHETRSGIDC